MSEQRTIHQVLIAKNNEIAFLKKSYKGTIDKIKNIRRSNNELRISQERYKKLYNIVTRERDFVLGRIKQIYGEKGLDLILKHVECPAGISRHTQVNENE